MIPVISYKISGVILGGGLGFDINHTTRTGSLESLCVRTDGSGQKKTRFVLHSLSDHQKYVRFASADRLICKSINRLGKVESFFLFAIFTIYSIERVFYCKSTVGNRIKNMN